MTKGDNMKTRAEWAKRPLPERVKAFVDWQRSDAKVPLLVDEATHNFALLCPDVPADDLGPYMAAAAVLVASTPEERTVPEIIKVARALRDAAKAGA